MNLNDLPPAVGEGGSNFSHCLSRMSTHTYNNMDDPPCIHTANARPAFSKPTVNCQGKYRLSNSCQHPYIPFSFSSEETGARQALHVRVPQIPVHFPSGHDTEPNESDSFLQLRSSEVVPRAALFTLSDHPVADVVDLCGMKRRKYTGKGIAS